jgi:putative ABC transport system substrate-binding protein
MLLSLFAGAGTSSRLTPGEADEPAKLLRLGVLSPGVPGPGYRAFIERLHGLGYDEGRNLKIHYSQFNSADPDRTLAMARQLADSGLDVIFAIGPEVALKSAVTATRTLPIVMEANDYDPLAHGYVASLARPGGNVTGIFFQQIELVPKQLEFLTQTVPDLARVVVLWDRVSADQFEAVQDAARSLNILLHGIECADPPYDYERALAGVDGEHRDVLLQLTSPLFFQDRERFQAVALAHRLPTMFTFRQWVDAGGLMSYGASLSGMGRLAADYVDRIARGAKPADLPVLQPTKFELIINLKTAKALGRTVPPAILARADEVIE